MLKNDRIFSMHGIQGEKSTKADYKIDLQGKTVFPGIINTHTHIQLIAPTVIYSLKMLDIVKKYHDKQIEKRMFDCLNHGITVVRDSGTFYKPLSNNRKLKARIEKGEIKRPRMFQSIAMNILGNYMAESLGLPDLILPILGMGYKYSDPESSIIVFPEGASLQQIRDNIVDQSIKRGLKTTMHHAEVFSFKRAEETS